MSETSSSTAAVVKSRPVLIALGVGLVVLLIWLLAFFLPQGKDLSKYHAQQQQLQTQQSQLEVQLAQLRATSKATPRLLALQAQYTNLVPPTADIYNYINLMSSTAAASGMHLVSITPSSTGTPVPGTSLQAIPVSLVTTGSYDSTLGFIKAVYALPRLTVVNSMSLTGGGPGTNRSTSLNESFSLTIYTTFKPATP
ncbi:MAG TPA: type 4a pilus biogenesis protein PilO [Acidimicrobiales bacterium]|nr:type 4a pilus biogenesis protein PilO [Acidimicrobiales bacterium]